NTVLQSQVVAVVSETAAITPTPYMRCDASDATPQIRRLLPGVTAAATTAVFATGDGPGVTAAATTAAFATGAPTTPTLPTRAALRARRRLRAPSRRQSRPRIW